MEPFFDEALKSIGHNHMLQRQLAALQDLQAVLQRLSTALESRQGVSRVYKLILSQPLLEITTSCCLELKDALEAALDGDFQVCVQHFVCPNFLHAGLKEAHPYLFRQVPLDVVEDLHSVVLKLDDLEFEDAVRDINIVQGMQRQLQSLQITWDTAGFHDSLMKSLESVGEFSANATPFLTTMRSAAVLSGVCHRCVHTSKQHGGS